MARVLLSATVGRGPTQFNTAGSVLRECGGESGIWTSLQVGFLVISKRDDGTLAASFVDPHGDHLADAKFKLRALADYAEQYGTEFLRIESVAKAGSTLRTLDLRTCEQPSAPSRVARSPRCTSPTLHRNYV